MKLLRSLRNGGLRYLRIKRRSELSGYELTGMDCITTLMEAECVIRNYRYLQMLQYATSNACDSSLEES